MKKTLTLLLALFVIGVTSSVRAEDAIKWELDPETSQNSPIAVNVDNGNKLRFTLPTGWSVSFKKKDNNDNKSYSPIKINEEALDKYTEREKTNRNTSPKVITKPSTKGNENSNRSNTNLQLSFIYNDNHGDGGLPITVTVDKPNEGDELTLLYRADDGFFGGFTKLKDSQTLEKEKKEKERQLAEEKQIEEERKHVEQKKLEESMLKQIREEDHKPWHQRLSENIQDQWWNFKGLFQ
ncbi:TPA: hypothetical protein ACQN7J_001194 [Streptococcus pyogenes]|uniref:hypothetical protein n=1 Tax=Streptococcus pyogenes TaxID=1314 RepID=UPI0000D7509C|nr:hypothetical protein [Streptococcus pyogenes]HER4560774.1 hypothetical protein [Streptococcus pyogenes NGAS671]HER4769368.1 hypothetical protein [Streptococcus pyogenes NGAS226]ABF33424.1 hypothetical protein MGAS10270_Spy0359 [Streptococcus pyogenes MGAS10270]PMD81250.1 hypothetical protein CEH03_02525 [Streptococcus pyogenes]UEN82378.1 hypothetical protein H7796_01910 [Streptococcus pyogenes]